MMNYQKANSKHIQYEGQIQPWNSDQSQMLNHILQPPESQFNSPKHFSHEDQSEKQGQKTTKKDSHSFNFYTNLRKYEKKKAHDFTCKKQVNFIEKNKKELADDFMNFQDEGVSLIMKKIQNQKLKKDKALENQFNNSLQSVNWSLIMYYEEDKALKKQRHRDIQSFLRFQSNKNSKSTPRKLGSQERSQNIQQNNKYQTDNYQRILKLRQNLRKRNLKSAENSRKTIKNSLNIEQNLVSIPNSSVEPLHKNFKRSLPKTSQSSRKAVYSMQKSTNLSLMSQSTVKKQNINDMRMSYISHNNRPQKMFT